MGKGDYLGEFEHLVLLAAIRDDGKAYGVSIHSEIERRTGREVILGQVYSALERLERKGLLRSEITEPEPVRGGRAKRVFSVTPAGRSAVVDAGRMIERMREGLTLTATPGTGGGT